MSYQETAVRTWNENILFSALVELTYDCNLDCFFCYNDLKLRGKRMTLSDYERFFEDLAGLSCLHLTLSGGEPLAHPDFFAIGASARKLGFAIRIKSNAHSIRGRILERLIEDVDPLVVDVSLHGSAAETHDRQTRIPGSFDRLLANLAAMKEAGLRFKINTTLTRWNEREVEGMYAIADRLGAPLTVDPDVSPRDDGDFGPLAIKATADGLGHLNNVQTKRSEALIARQGDAELPSFDARKHCGAGSSGIAVDPFGNVYPCVQWRRPVGNLHERSVREIWESSAGLGEVRELSETIKRLRPKPYCPGAQESLTGSPLPAAVLLPLHPV